MNIKPLNIETILSGFIHLIWMTLLTLFILGESPEKTINFVANISAGTAALVLAFIFAFSFFLGRIFEHFIIALNYFRKSSDEKKKHVELFKENSEETWGNKIFSFSSFCGLLFFGIIFCILINPLDAKWPVLLINLLLLIVTLTSTIYWWKFGKEVIKLAVNKS